MSISWAVNRDGSVELTSDAMDGALHLDAETAHLLAVAVLAVREVYDVEELDPPPAPLICPYCSRNHKPEACENVDKGRPRPPRA